MTDITPRLHADIAAVLADAPRLDLADIPAARAARLAQVAGSDAEIVPQTVELADIDVRGTRDRPAVRMRSYRPPNAAQNAPALLWVHGGGHVLGHARQDGVRLAGLAAATGTVAYSVECRLAPDHPFPAEVEDCFAALEWVHAHAAEQGLDPARIVVGGASSGGGTAAALALMARDRGAPPLAHQLLLYPMLDDRHVTPSSRAITDARVWDRHKNEVAWRAYLGGAAGSETVSPYAAPARAHRLNGLPPASIFVGDCDPFVDECLHYASRLIAAEVWTELRVYAGCPHGFDRVAPDSSPTLTLREDLRASLRAAIGG